MREGLGLSTSHTSPFDKNPPPQSGLSEYYGDHRATLRREDLEWVARADGRSLDVTGRYEFVPNEPELILRLGGSLSTVKTGLGGGAAAGGVAW